MRFDTRTLVLVVRRLERLRERPSLFNDRMVPWRVLRRADAVCAWLGSTGRMVVSEHLRARSTPEPGARKWGRGGYTGGSYGDGAQGEVAGASAQRRGQTGAGGQAAEPGR